MKINLKTGLIVIFAAAVIIYFSGPRVKKPIYNPSLPQISDNGDSIENYVRTMEKPFKIKPGNEAEIIWQNKTTKEKTPIALLYLHGFSASREEGNPIHLDFARRYGANLYQARLYDHGIDTSEPLINLNAEDLWESAKTAYAIASKLGDTVIIMGTSTGGSLALKLASVYPKISAIILLSPNIEINKPLVWLANNNWGVQMVRIVSGGDYIYSSDHDTNVHKYWYNKYRAEAVSNLQELVETSMNKETFAKVKCPALLLYYYKNKKEQDKVVLVSASIKMFENLGTPDSLKQKKSIPKAGSHVIGSKWMSKDLPGVEAACYEFAEKILHLKPSS